MQSQIKVNGDVASADPARSLLKGGRNGQGQITLGRFQWFALLTGIFTFAVGGMLLYNLSFLELLPKYSEDSEGNPVYPYECLLKGKADYAGCTQKEACGSGVADFRVNWKAREAIHNWAQKDKLDLYCTDRSYIGLVGSMLFGGWVLGLLFLPVLADKYGRKWIVVSAVFIEFLLYITLFFTTQLYVVIICQFLEGIVVSAKSTLNYVYTTEFLPVNKRVLMGIVLGMIDGSTLIWSSLYWAYNPYWKPLFYFIFLVEVAVLVCLVIRPESPVQLYSTNKLEQSKAIFQQMARWNGATNFPQKFLFDKEAPQELLSAEEREGEKEEKEEGREEERQYETKDLFRNRQLLVNLVGMSVLWAVSSFDFYIVNFYFKQIKGSIYLNVGFAGVSQIVAKTCGGSLIKVLGPKKPFLVAFAFSIVGAVCNICVNPDHVKPIVFAVFTMLTQFGVAATFTMAYIVTQSFFPTAIAATAFGYSNVTARVLTFLAPLVAELEHPVPMVVFAVFALLACGATLLLKEFKEQATQPSK